MRNYCENCIEYVTYTVQGKPPNQKAFCNVCFHEMFVQKVKQENSQFKEDKIYVFDESLKESEQYERELDDYYGHYYQIEKVSMELQHKGIDRIFTKKDGKKIFVEYKSDKLTKTTNNVFIETISNSETHSEGWAVKSQSEYIFYYCIGIGIFVAQTEDIRRKLPEWIEKYPLKSCKNDKYLSYGRLVPLEEFKKISRTFNY